MCSDLIQNLTDLRAEIVSATATLLAAFLGAWFAFLLQDKKELRKERDINVLALNKVQVNLTQQLNVLVLFNKDFVEPYRNHPISWLAVPAAPPRNYSKLQIDAGSLSFLVEKNRPELILEILVVEEKFQEVINLINLRSEAHVRRLQPQLERIGFREGQPFDKSPAELEELLGPRLVLELKRLTAGLITNTEDAIQAHEEIIKEIKKVGAKMFPKKRILSFEYKNQNKKI